MKVPAGFPELFISEENRDCLWLSCYRKITGFASDYSFFDYLCDGNHG